MATLLHKVLRDLDSSTHLSVISRLMPLSSGPRQSLVVKPSNSSSKQQKERREGEAVGKGHASDF